MHVARLLGGIFCIVLCHFLAIPALAVDSKEAQLQALGTILAELKTHYGMIRFKADTFGTDYNALSAKYSALITDAKTLEEDAGLSPVVVRGLLSPDEFRQLMVGLAAEFRDGHTNILRNSDRGWTVGLRTASIEGKLYVTGFRDDFYQPAAAFPAIEVGDEIVSVNGVPVETLAVENMFYVQAATYASRHSLALERILNRSFRNMRALPDNGPVEVTLRRGPTEKDQTFAANFHWMNTRDPAEIATFYRFVDPEKGPRPQPKLPPYTYGEWSRSETYFNEGLKKLALPSGTVLNLGKLLNAEIEEARAAKRDKQPYDKDLALLSSIPRLWVQIVRHEGKQIGILRIPDYSPADLVAELKWLKVIIGRLEGATDALIIDQLSNGGGYIYHFAQFVGFFADKRAIDTGTIEIKLNETFLNRMADPGDPDRDTGKELHGARPNFVQLALRRAAYQKLREKFDGGEQWSGPMSFYSEGDGIYAGVPGRVVGRKGALYTKPVLILNDLRSGSGGDFMPGTMQAAKRALVFGETSMGLGGPVYRSQDTLPGSEMFMRCTFGFCRRADGLPLENIGVVPDVSRPITAGDLKEGFTSYAREALDAGARLAKNEGVVEIRRAVAAARELRLGALADPNPAYTALQALTRALKPEIERTNVAGSALALYEKFFEDSFALDLATIAEGEWARIELPLPPVMTKGDAVLASLTKRAEILERIAELRRLPPNRGDETFVKLADVLVAGLGKLKAFQVPSCIHLLARN